FNPSTRIEYSIPKDGHVLLGVFDILGRQVAVLESGVKPAGSHSVTFDASGLASGVYLYRLEVDRFTIVREMLVVK
ncbi:MAG TPA: peptidase S8, partial [Bacteroidetes bacterium]|nr:peptidase S8 [Bacteroidota bacterium]